MLRPMCDQWDKVEQLWSFQTGLHKKLQFCEPKLVQFMTGCIKSHKEYTIFFYFKYFKIKEKLLER